MEVLTEVGRSNLQSISSLEDDPVRREKVISLGFLLPEFLPSLETFLGSL